LILVFLSFKNFLKQFRSFSKKSLREISDFSKQGKVIQNISSQALTESNFSHFGMKKKRFFRKSVKKYQNFQNQRVQIPELDARQGMFNQYFRSLAFI
jgi:hypothetical protein